MLADGLIEPFMFPAACVVQHIAGMLVGVSLVVLRRGHRARGEVVAVS